jgi:hypothetical protein
VEDFTVTTPLWRWQSATAPAAWFFVSISGDVADGIRLAAIGGHWVAGLLGLGWAGGGAAMGDSVLKTSVFPHKQRGGWLLPVKAAVRKAEGLAEGDAVTVTVSL